MKIKNAVGLVVLFVLGFGLTGCEDPQGCVMGKLTKDTLLTYRYSLRQLQANRTDVFEALCKQEFLPNFTKNQLRAPYLFFGSCIQTQGKSCKVPADQLKTFETLHAQMGDVLVAGQMLCTAWVNNRVFDASLFTEMLDAMDHTDATGQGLQAKYCSHH